MKINFLALTTLLLLAYNSNICAQPQRSYSSASNIITVNGATLPVTNLYTLDSLKMPHFASFDIEVSSDADTKKVLESFFSAASGKQQLKITIGTVNFQNQVTEQRNYNSAMVAEIDVPDLNASSRDVAKIKVKILSQDMNTAADKSQSTGKLSVQSKRAMTNSYKLSLGSLPTTKVTGISNLKTSSFLNTGYFNFNIELERTDAKQWKDWFNASAGGKTEEGTLTLTDQTLSDIAYIQISGVEIVAVSETTKAGDAIAKTVIGLRARRLSFSMK